MLLQSLHSISWGIPLCHSSKVYTSTNDKKTTLHVVLHSCSIVVKMPPQSATEEDVFTVRALWLISNNSIVNRKANLSSLDAALIDNDVVACHNDEPIVNIWIWRACNI